VPQGSKLDEFQYQRLVGIHAVGGSSSYRKSCFLSANACSSAGNAARDAVGRLWHAPAGPANYSKLMSLLPTMAPAAAQEQWTGSSGTTLLAQSVSAMRSMESLHARHRGSSLHRKRILDFGCGWGRLLRLALYYADPDSLHGVDPWDESIRLCREHRVPGEIRQCEYLPANLPVSSPFDVAFAFSVFTHLSERAMLYALKALRQSAAPGATLFFTIRPVEYWRHHQQFHTKSRDQLLEEHATKGFAVSGGLAPHRDRRGDRAWCA